jgi:hypothetical protein
MPLRAVRVLAGWSLLLPFWKCEIRVHGKCRNEDEGMIEDLTEQTHHSGASFSSLDMPGVR